MADLKIRIDGKEMEVPFGTSIKDILSIKSAQPYADNPIAGAVVNGMLMSLQEGLKGNADIRTVRVASPLGKRIYRKSLCFLLSYASAAIAPERTLIIGHSLGDGYYFRYRDGEKPDTEKLRSVMNEAISSNLPIELIELTHDEGIEYAEQKGLKETEELLKTLNQAFYRFARIGTCMEMYYEPLLPSLKYLKLWELREYEDGLLLRYPQMRSPYSIMPFTDNPLLFSVFNNNSR